MTRKKKTRETIDAIEPRWHNFDFLTEKSIYCYLCRMRMKRKISRRLDDNFKFEAYQRWKQYICDKYDDFSHEQLIEFSRYLNLLIRNKKPAIAYWKIVMPVILTVFLTKLFDMVFELNVDLSQNIFVLIAECIIFTIVFISEIFIIIRLSMTPLFRDDSDANMLKDYKEIIDEMILEKESGNNQDGKKAFYLRQV